MCVCVCVCVLTRAKVSGCGISMQGEAPLCTAPAQPNEPVDPVRLGDVTRYSSRLNVASATLTLKQESTRLLAPDLAANLQVQVARARSPGVQRRAPLVIGEGLTLASPVRLTAITFKCFWHPNPIAVCERDTVLCRTSVCFVAVFGMHRRQPRGPGRNH